MVQHLDSRISEGMKRKTQPKPTPSSQELAKRYFDLQRLRQIVRNAESGQIVGPDRTPSPPLASFT